MAFRSNGPVQLTLPAFRGFTRQLVIVCLATFFGFIVLAAFGHGIGEWLLAHFALTPYLVAHGFVWQLLTYAVFPISLLSELFALLSVWFFGSALEDELGERWLREFFFASVVGGALLATVVAWTCNNRAFGIGPELLTVGLYPFIMALLLAFARLNADQEILLFFAIRLKAKYLVAIYLLYYLGSTLLGGDHMGALTAVCTALAAWLYLRFAPRRGVLFAGSERWYGFRNAFYRNKRKRAAKKFEVYMREQGRDVHFDSQGRYVDDEKRNPNDRRWMN